MRPLLLLPLLLSSLVVASPEPSALPAVRIVEVVASPQTDWNEDGKLTGSDEFVELLNAGDVPLDLSGWRLLLNDTTPDTFAIMGTLAPGERRAIVNPPGELNNNAHAALFDATGQMVDEIRYGSWPGSTLPSAASTSPEDEALRLVETTWSRGHATPNQGATGPMVRHRPPFEAGLDGRRFDPGERQVTWALEWTDADRPYSEARAEAITNVTIAVAAPVTYTGGRGTAQGTLVTPVEDFDWRWVLIDSQGIEWPGPTSRVHIDRTAPSAPVLDLPAWTNLDAFPIRAETAADEGVGGVEYALILLDDSNETLLAGWSASPDFGTIALGDAPLLRLRADARDAFGHVAQGAVAGLGVDAQPPPHVNVTAEGGYDRVRLSWLAVQDAGSGIETFIVRRVRPSLREWRLAPDADGFEDATFRLGDAVAYEVHAVDRAGNAGNATRLNVSYEGERPHAKQLRAAKPVWGAGELRIHVDFDRAMNTTLDPVLTVDGEAASGRWLANRSSYLVELEPYEGPPRGQAIVRLEDARDARGQGLWSPLARSVPTDGAPPTLTSSDRNGWVNATGLQLAASDAGGAARLRYRVEGATEWTESDAAVQLDVEDAVRVEAQAMDDAGWRSGEIDRLIRADLEPPRLSTPLLSRGLVRVPYEDEGAGLDATTVRALDASTGEPLVARTGDAAITVDPGRASRVRLEVRDRVGNLAVAEWAAPAPVGAASTLPSLRESWAKGAARPAAAAEPAAPPVLDWQTAGTGGAGLAALALVLGTVRAHRRRREAPSLARRLRRLRGR